MDTAENTFDWENKPGRQQAHIVTVAGCKGPDDQTEAAVVAPDIGHCNIGPFRMKNKLGLEVIRYTITQPPLARSYIRWIPPRVDVFAGDASASQLKQM